MSRLIVRFFFPCPIIPTYYTDRQLGPTRLVAGSACGTISCVVPKILRHSCAAGELLWQLLVKRCTVSA